MDQYINELKSTKPAPGGGSVAAILAELSAALLHMACTISAQSSQATEEKRSKLNVVCERIDACLVRGDSLALQDEEAYREVARAFKTKARTSEESSERKKTIEVACLNACAIPCEVIDLAKDVLLLAKDVLPYINRSLMSDVAIVVAIVQAASKSALYLVHANLSYLDIDDAHRVYKRAHESYNSIAHDVSILQEKLDAILLSTPLSGEDI